MRLWCCARFPPCMCVCLCKQFVSGEGTTGGTGLPSVPAGPAGPMFPAAASYAPAAAPLDPFAGLPSVPTGGPVVPSAGLAPAPAAAPAPRYMPAPAPAPAPAPMRGGPVGVPAVPKFRSGSVPPHVEHGRVEAMAAVDALEVRPVPLLLLVCGGLVVVVVLHLAVSPPHVCAVLVRLVHVCGAQRNDVASAMRAIESALAALRSR